MIRILFQGDSITDGNRYKEPAKRWDLNHQIGHTYVYPIVSYLGRLHPGKYFFINRGISGDSAEKAIDRWQTDTLDEHPDILSTLFGINGNANRDGVFPEGVEANLERFEKSYREILRLAREQNPDLKLILIEPFFLPVGRYIEHYNDFMPAFRRKQKIVERIANDFGGIFIPTQKRLEKLVVDCREELIANGCDTDPNAYWLWDGVHPTENFHGYLAEWWLDAAKDIL